MAARLRMACYWLLVLLLVGCGGQKYTALPPGSTVLVLGDSISYGTGATPGEDYPSLLAAATGWQVINAGVPGDTTADGLQRLPALLDQHAPRLLLVELGGNDFLKHVDRAQTRANLQAIMELAKARGVQAVLVAMPSFNLLGAAVGRLSDHPLYQELADANGTPIIGEAVAEVLGQADLRADQIHPNAAGYRALEKRLREALQQYGFAR